MTLSAKISLGLRFRVMSQNVNFLKFFILFQRSLDGEHPALHSVLTANFSPLMQKNPHVDEIERFFFMCIYTTSPLGGGQRTWRQQKVIYNADDEEEALLVIHWAHGGSGEGGWGTSLIGRDREWGGGVIQTSLQTETRQKWPFVSTHNTNFFSLS